MIVECGFGRGLLVLLTLFTVIVVGGSALQRRLASKTVGNWSGTGVNRELAPWQAAVLLRLHPSVIVAIYLVELELLGRARPLALPHEPCRMEWKDGPPEGPVEEALLAAVDEKGVFRTEGVVALLEAMWRDVDERMKVYSGRETAVHYREMAEKLWDEDFDALVEVPGSFPFFLLHDPGREWDRIGHDPVSERFREAFRTCERFRSELVSGDDYSRLAWKARSGFFLYRSDLVQESRGKWWGMRWFIKPQ